MKNSLSILSINTQVRSIAVLNRMIFEISDSTDWQLRLLDGLTKWSIDEEKNNPSYAASTGKLTEKGKPTNAFKFYLQFLSKTNLIVQFNDAIQLSKYGHIWQYFLKNAPANHNNYQSIFWAFWLFKYDFDILYVLLGIVTKNEKNSWKEIDIRQKYHFAMKAHLENLLKQPNVNKKYKDSIKYTLKTLSSEKETPNAFKHTVANRLAWLHSLNLLDRANNKAFSPTKKGESLRTLITEKKQVFLDDFVLVYTQDSPLQKFESLEIARIHHFFKQNIDLYYTQMKYDKEGAMRVSAHSFFMFIVLKLLADDLLISTTVNWEGLLKTPIVIDGIRYTYRPTANENESYISILSL